jgi:hypothetical protein
MNALWELYRASTGVWQDVAELNMLGAVLTLTSLDVDTLTWTQRKGSIPGDGETLALRRNGQILFQGVVTRRKYRYAVAGGQIYALTVSGALFYASVSEISDRGTDESGGTASRPTFQFPPGSLRGMVSRLLGSMPGIREGNISDLDADTVAGSFQMGRQTFTGGSYLSVLLALLKPVPDVVGYVDYSVLGAPQLCLRRRGQMSPVTFELGVDDVAAVDLTPRSELYVSGVALATTTRHPQTGKTVYGTQVAGTGAKLISFTGPEIGNFVPPDNLPKLEIQTTPLNASWAEISVLDTEIYKAVKRYGTFIPDGGVQLYNATYGTFAFINYAQKINQLPVGLTISDQDGQPASGYRLVAGQVTDFLKSDYGAVQRTLTVTGNVIGSWIGDYYKMPTIFQSLGSKIVATQSGPNNGTNGVIYTNYSLSFSYSVEVINLSFPTLTTLYAKAAYEYLVAPLNLAENMRRAGAFVPYEGEVVLNPKAPFGSYLGRRVNITNGSPDLGTAGALVQGMSVPLLTGVMSLRLGAPARVPLSAVLGRYNAGNGKDNIIQV